MYYNQVTGDGGLLEVTRDFFRFVTKFFEVVSISATHIYHSALELSPLSSIIRRLYHHRRIAPSSRVVIGTLDSWQPVVTLPNTFRGPHAWSLCGRFIASSIYDYVEVRDPLTSELLSTLRPDPPTDRLMRPLAYSPDGRSLCGASDTAITIWDIQTGGLVKEIERDDDRNRLTSLVWSLDGRTIGALLQGREIWMVFTYDVASGKKTPGSTFGSVDTPYLWAHGKSFRVMMDGVSDATAFNPQSDSKPYGGRTINILEVGPTLTRVKSFHVSVGQYDQIESFSPTSHHISVSTMGGQLLILDDRNSVRLSKREGFSESHCFSSDGNFFAAALRRNIHVWKCTRNLNSGYTPWRKFPIHEPWISEGHLLRFSPTSSSISGKFGDEARVWHLDDLPTAPVVNHGRHTIFSPHGNYIVTANRWEGTVTITNLRSQTPPQSIDTGAPVVGLALTGNILWVVNSGIIVAWRLTEEGQVDGVPENRMASRGDSIRSMEATGLPEFSVEGQTGFIALNGTVMHAYHIGSGGEVKNTMEPPGHWRTLEDTSLGRYHLHCSGVRLGDLGYFRDTPEEWAGDPEVRRRLWLPIEWRTIQGDRVKLFHDIGILQLDLPRGLIIIQF